MGRIEITPASIGRFDDIAEDMARAYQTAFGDPEGWNEISKCINESCTVGYCGEQVGDLCSGCGGVLIEAYDADELAAGWRNMVLDEDAFMEVALNKGGRVTSATIARPTNPSELIKRKYADDPIMAKWADATLPPKFTWIEDTFANRELQPSGNLARRSETLAAIALRYGGNDIVTRTIAPEIIGATARDAGLLTDMYVGTRGITGNREAQMRSVGRVPDWRTVLVIDGRRKQR